MVVMLSCNLCESSAKSAYQKAEQSRRQKRTIVKGGATDPMSSKYTTEDLVEEKKMLRCDGGQAVEGVVLYVRQVAETMMRFKADGRWIGS